MTQAILRWKQVEEECVYYIRGTRSVRIAALKPRQRTLYCFRGRRFCGSLSDTVVATGLGASSSSRAVMV